MNDRELLELAAKAAGLDARYDEENECCYFPPGKHSDAWNPLTDDGDALRLAVKLRLTLDIERDRCCVSVGDHTGKFGVQPWGKEGPEAATRRAIVRAAAEIGRAIK